MIGAWTNKQLSSLLKILGEHERSAEVAATERNEIAEHSDSDRHLIASHLLSQSALQWEALLNRAHVPAAKVRSLDETLQEEQLKYRGVIQEVEKADEDGFASFPVAAFTYAHGSPTVDAPPPRLGEHTEEVLLESGLSTEYIHQLFSDGAI